MGNLTITKRTVTDYATTDGKVFSDIDFAQAHQDDLNEQVVPFKQGQLVKCNLRTKSAQLFLLVMHDRNPSNSQFNAVVILDMSGVGYESEAGYISDSWNRQHFELTTWEEVKPYLK